MVITIKQFSSCVCSAHTKDSWTNIERSNLKKEKPFAKGKKLYITFSESFSSSISDIYTVYCTFCGVNFQRDHLYIRNIYIHVCMCVCIYLYNIYIYIYSSLEVFSTPFFSLSLQEKSLRVWEERVHIKIKGMKKKPRKKKPNHKTSTRLVLPLVVLWNNVVSNQVGGGWECKGERGSRGRAREEKRENRRGKKDGKVCSINFSVAAAMCWGVFR